MAVCSSTGAEGSGRVKATKVAKYCHQCHRLAKGVIVSCKARKGNKFCTVRYCQKCLQNRYQQTAEVVALDDCWRCPKCQDICNCSNCRKKNVPISSGVVSHLGSSDRALLDKNSTEILDCDRSARVLHVFPKDAGSENHVTALSDDEKKHKRVQDGCTIRIQDDTDCVAISKVMCHPFTMTGLEGNLPETILPQEKHKRVEQGCTMQDGTRCISQIKVMGHIFTLNRREENLSEAILPPERHKIVTDGCTMQDGTRCIPQTKVMGRIFTLNRLEEKFSETILPQERHKIVRDGCTMQDGTPLHSDK